MLLNEDVWLAALAKEKAFLRWSGRQKDPHFLLRADGHHTDEFLDCRGVSMPLLHAMCDSLVSDLSLLKATEGRVPIPDVIVGCGGGGALLAPLIAAYMGCLRHGYTKKVNEDDCSPMLCEGCIGTGMRVLLVDDVFTTGSTLQRSIDGLRHEHDVEIERIALVLFNRSLSTCWNGFRVFPLIHRPLQSWTPDKCRQSGPCKVGSKAVRPRKGGAHG